MPYTPTRGIQISPILRCAMAPTPPIQPAAPSTGPRVSIIDATRRLSHADQDFLADCLGRAIARLGAVGECRVQVIADAAMAAAHETYGGVPGTTDVLTFDLTDGDGAGRGELDVDIMVCLDEAERQAAARGHQPRREMLLYAIHGVLHCLGHDDHDDEAFARMHAEEDRLMDWLGVGETFARPPVSEPTP
jgi:probable rRNA maturation factor